MSAPAKTRTDGVRPRFADVVREHVTVEYLDELLTEVKGRTKGAFGYCPNCRRKVQCEVSDVAQIVKTIVELMEQVEGKPGTVVAEDAGVTLVVKRNWPVGPVGLG